MTFKLLQKTLLFSVALGFLAGCSDDIYDSDSQQVNVPQSTNFDEFVTSLLSADPATATPREINDVDFAFPQNNNPAAFNDQLQ